ncbi:MAG: SurA N-terminal domain-containing protein [Deltaproteobacteria bacterium]|nr:SurA N-terminal domain-containing protein [Deltaproteobacteria bacterium]
MLVPGRTAAAGIMTRRRVVWSLAAMLMLAAFIAGALAMAMGTGRSATPTADSGVESAIVARVNGVPITIAELERAMAALRESSRGNNFAAWRARVLDSLINAELFRQAARARDGDDTAPPEAVRDAIEDARAESFAQPSNAKEAGVDLSAGHFVDRDEYKRDLSVTRETARRYRERVEALRRSANLEVDETALAAAGIRPR